MNLAEEQIKNLLKKANIQTNSKWVTRIWWSLSIGIGGALLIDFIGLFYGYTYLLFLGSLLMIIGIIFTVYYTKQAKKIINHNQRIIAGTIPSLHQIYYENNPQLFSNFALQFKGIHQSELFLNNCFHFYVGSEKITWNIDEDIEKRTRVYTDSKGHLVTTTYNVYILKFCLVSTAEKLANMQSISISEGKAPKNDESFFHSESIEFDDRFKVQSFADKMEVYKLFTPKIIDNFVQKQHGFLGSRTIRVSDGKVQISWRGRERTSSWIPDPLDYTKIRWTKNKMLMDVMNKITLDFNRYLEIQNLLEPLDLYQQA